MNRINFIYLLVSVLLAFTACSNEELIEKHPDGNYTSKLNITLSTASAITKAGEQELFPATDQEKTIKSCVLGVFEKIKDGYRTVEILQPTLNEVTGNKGTYSIESNIELTFTKTYKLVVIANGSFDLYKNCETYNALKGVVEGGEIYDFKPDRLLKYREIEVGFGTPNELKVDTQLNIELTQLAARIDLKINVNLEGKKELIGVSYEALNGSSLLGKDVDNLKLFGGKVYNGLPNEYSNHDFYFQGRKVTLENPLSSSTKVGVIKDYTFNRVKTYKSWVMEPTKILIENIRSQVIAVLSANEFDLKYCNYSLPDKDKIVTQYLTFYTYQRSVGENSSNNLHVEIEGKIYSAEIKEKVQLTGDWLAFNLKKENLLDNLLKETIEGKTSSILIEESGQGNGYCILVEDATLGMEEIPGVDEIINRGDYIDEYNGGFDIVPVNGNTVQYGNYYKVTATIRNVKFPVSLTWKILPWSDIFVQVPSFD